MKKKFEQKIVNGVEMGHGMLSFKRIKLNVHCYFMDGILIDTGARSLEKLFKPFFKQLDIDKVVITHFHEDHTGCAAFLQKEREVPILMDDTMLNDCMKKADYPLYRQLFWGKRKPFRAEPIGETFQSRHASWQVIKTPGHAIDHLSFLNKETGQLFTGDLYCQEKTKVVLREENMPVLIDSLKRTLTYDFDEVFCSHAGHLKNGRTALKGKLDYLLDLQGTILNMYEEGKTPEEINAELFPKKYPITFFSSGEWDSIHIVRTVINEKDPSLALSSGT
ncbi:MBL fold metallo-hydrolase [Alkalihalophilus lindianensis]|uniref:MBL fold metallo-hydrolase n=1 Tax=Alkalihalophilus lindianensis TaxID=1630542 RepID=A0ABU3XEV0_9BACI|nr:MBL fold metallo-hydrolase [Alkalihalophilus lindianensis]MDV2686147.1 MBL fold metallo-hydrolase [Alkalihalophilus lindianensis]